MTFKKFMICYVVLFLLFIVGLCTVEWSALGKYQRNYDASKLLKEKDSLKQTDTLIETTIPLNEYDIIIDSTMTVKVEGKEYKAVEKSDLSDSIYKDVSKLLGSEIKKSVCTVMAKDIKDIEVYDYNGNRIELSPENNDYVSATYTENEEISNMAIQYLKHYIRHINGLESLDSLLSIMKSDSPAYKAIVASQNSLEWLIDAKTMEFTKEQTNDLQFFDDNHFAIDVSLSLTRVTDTEVAKTVNEDASYRILFENVNGKWMIHSFLVK